MAYLDVLVIFTVLLCTGILSASQSTSTEEAAADDDDEIALEDYVDNELPNFSGDVSSAVFGDTTGYDVHIEVKIANRSKTKTLKDESIEASDTSPISTISSKNRMKAKKILDLIIEKLKHKKDVREKIDDSTDVEIEDDADKTLKRKEKLAKTSSHTRTDESLNEDAGESPKGDIVDSIEQKSENKGNHLPLKDQEISSSLKSKEENMVSQPTKVKGHNLPSANKKKDGDFPSQFSIKEQEMHLPSRKKGASNQKIQHTFNLPHSDNSQLKEESFSFQKPSPHHMPKTSTLSAQEESAQATTSKPVVKNGKLENNKYIKIKVSGDEIRIKVPEFLNKTALFSKIVSLIEDDGKKSQPTKLVRPKPENGNLAKKPFHDIGSKLSNATPPYYKFLLLKKIHKEAEKPATNELEPITDHHISSEAIGNIDDSPSARPSSLHKDNINEPDDVPVTRLNSLKDKNGDNLDEVPVSRLNSLKDKNGDNLDEVPVTRLNSLKEKSGDNLDDVPVSRLNSLKEKSSDNIDEVPTSRLNSLKEKNNDLLDDITTKKKDTSFDRQDEVSEKKMDHTLTHVREESTEHNSILPAGGLLEGKEDLSERVKLHENKEEMSEKDKASMVTVTGDSSELVEKADGTKNEAFVPNNVASKSFQENLEPAEMPNMKPVEISTTKVSNAKVLNIVPDELHIEEVETTEKENIHAPKPADTKPAIVTNHKLESSNSNSIIDGVKHNEDHAPKLNPGRLFNDSLFQQAGMENVDSEGKHKIEKPQEAEVPPNADDKQSRPSQIINEKKSEKNSAPIIDVLTFPEFSQEKPLLNIDREKSHMVMEDHNEQSHADVSKHKSHVIPEKHEKTHNVVDEKHEKSRLVGKDKHEKFRSNVGDNNHVKSTENMVEEKHDKPESMLTDKEEKQPEPISTEKFKPLNNPLPSILFKEILHTDNTVAKLSKKSKHNKKKEKMAAIEDEEKPLKKATEREKEEGGDTPAPEHAHKSSVTSRTKDGAKSVGTKLDLSDLESLQLQSKDNIELGADDEEEGTGDDADEYEDASGDDDDISEMKDSPDQSNLSIANLAIWKASEDIHALLHSLTDREHADKVLGNLRNFIRNKHSGEAKKRDVFDPHDSNTKKKAKSNHLPDSKSKSIVKSAFPEFLDVKKSSVPYKYEHMIDLKKKSDIPRKVFVSNHKRHLKPEKRKRRIIEFEKYTNHTGNGLDRLYNQLATANARIPPTFADDADGWSSDEVSNVMTQLKSTDIDDDFPTANGVLNPEYQDIGGVASYTGRHSNIGLPQGAGHAADNLPMKELIGYQKELRNSMLQNKLLHNKPGGLFSKSPSLPEFRKNQVSKASSNKKDTQGGNLASSRGNIASSEEGNLASSEGGNLASSEGGNLASYSSFPSNSTVQLANGDYIEGTTEYNLNKDKLWLNRDYKKDSIEKNVET